MTNHQPDAPQGRTFRVFACGYPAVPSRAAGHHSGADAEMETTKDGGVVRLAVDYYVEARGGKVRVPVRATGAHKVQQEKGRTFSPSPV